MLAQTEMTDAEIRDQLVTLLTAGHETTAATLAWAVERLRRHPDVLERLQEGDKPYRDAFIREVQRQRPVIAFAARSNLAPVRARRLRRSRRARGSRSARR